MKQIKKGEVVVKINPIIPGHPPVTGTVVDTYYVQDDGLLWADVLTYGSIETCAASSWMLCEDFEKNGYPW